LWQAGFFQTSLLPVRRVYRFLDILICRIFSRAFLSLLRQEDPDAIVSTHFLTCGLSSYLKERGLIDSRLITVITDFDAHPLWISPLTDMYVVASDTAANSLKKLGIGSERIRASGIPVEPKFLSQEKGPRSREAMRLSKERFTVLVVTGSFGLGPVEQIVRAFLGQDIQLLVVCGANNSLYQRLKLKGYPDVKAFGFINNLQELMAASDMIITKPGGLTLSEALVMDLVPVFVSPIPGQERANIRVLMQHGIGHFPKDISEIKDIVCGYKDNPERLLEAKGLIERLKKPQATQELCDAICQGGFGPTR
jgi:processive 1,2-diacylglycerol beta-glucosyltransferase